TVGALLLTGQLVLGLALALLLAALALEAGIAGDVSGRLLGSAGQLVDQAHECSSSCRGSEFTYPTAAAFTRLEIGALSQSGSRVLNRRRHRLISPLWDLSAGNPRPTAGNGPGAWGHRWRRFAAQGGGKAHCHD